MTTDCVIVQPIAGPGVSLLRGAGLAVFEAPSTDLEILRPHLATARAAITRNEGFSAEAIDAAPNLVLIASHGTGTDRIAMDAARRRGIQVVSTPGENANSVAEHTLALILACARHLTAADAAVRSGDWGLREALRPRDIAGRTLGLVGFGHVARHLARIARGLGLQVMVLSAHATDEDLSAVAAERAPDLPSLLAAADIVSLHGRPETGPLLDAEAFGQVRPGAILVNTARGALVVEAALAAALRDGRLFAAALDVFREEPLPADSPLLDCPNVIFTPHMGGSSQEALDRTAVAVARKVIEGLGLPVPS